MPKSALLAQAAPSAASAAEPSRDDSADHASPALLLSPTFVLPGALVAVADGAVGATSSSTTEWWVPCCWCVCVLRLRVLDGMEECTRWPALLVAAAAACHRCCRAARHGAHSTIKPQHEPTHVDVEGTKDGSFHINMRGLVLWFCGAFACRYLVSLLFSDALDTLRSPGLKQPCIDLLYSHKSFHKQRGALSLLLCAAVAQMQAARARACCPCCRCCCARRLSTPCEPL